MKLLCAGSVDRRLGLLAEVTGPASVFLAAIRHRPNLPDTGIGVLRFTVFQGETLNLASSETGGLAMKGFRTPSWFRRKGRLKELQAKAKSAKREASGRKKRN